MAVSSFFCICQTSEILNFIHHMIPTDASFLKEIFADAIVKLTLSGGEIRSDVYCTCITPRITMNCSYIRQSPRGCMPRTSQAILKTDEDDAGHTDVSREL